MLHKIADTLLPISVVDTCYFQQRKLASSLFINWMRNVIITLFSQRVDFCSRVLTSYVRRSNAAVRLRTYASFSSIPMFQLNTESCS